MIEFTDLITGWRQQLSTMRVTSQSATALALRPSLLFMSSPPPPPLPPPSPLPLDGIGQHLPILMRYPLSPLSSNQTFLCLACNLMYSQGKKPRLLEVDFFFI